jgi:lipopolysaccharide transport system ATP-binding protein
MKPIIKIDNLSKQYRIGAREAYSTLRDTLMGTLRSPFKRFAGNGKTKETIWALSDVSLEVAPGEVLGIVGRNGAGKSTLLKILSRITEPTTGRVELYGRVGSLLEVGTGFHPELTGRENIYLNGAILGMQRREIEKKFDEIVAFAEIEKFLDTPVKRYSSGMYMRLAFAVAAHLEPEILLVDEVLAVGDAQFQKKCLGKMSQVAKQGRTVLFVSHNMTAIKSLCRRVAWLDQGQIVESGNTEQVVLSYLVKGSHATLEQVWDDPQTAPGNEKIRIRSARLRPLASPDSAEIGVETPLEVSLEFWNYQAGPELNFTLHLTTIDGTHVFAAGSEVKARPLGLIRESLKIPGNFLNDGIYSMEIQVVQDQSFTAYSHPEILVFEVLDSSREGGWFGKWPGVIRPRLEWISQDLTAKEEACENA